MAEQRLGLGLLDDTAQVHDRDPLRHMVDHPQIVADEKARESETALQILQKVQDLRLHRDIERRGRLVADQQAGLMDRGPCDGDTLALAT
ncbi:MAG: hypothetical protein ABWY12_15470 [Burkholderiales bacterium]